MRRMPVFSRESSSSATEQSYRNPRRGRKLCGERRRAMRMRAGFLAMERLVKVREGQWFSPAGRVAGAPRNRNRLTPNESQFEAAIVASTVKGAAAGETGRGATERSGARIIAPTMRAGIEEAALQATNREREIVAARFAFDSKVGAGPAPFGAVWGDSPAAGARLRDEMRQFMAQGAIDLRLAKGAKTAVEQNTRAAVIRATGGGTNPCRPFDADQPGDRGRAVLEQQGARNRFQRRITSRRFFRNGGRERKLELAKREHVGLRCPPRPIFGAAGCDR